LSVVSGVVLTFGVCETEGAQHVAILNAYLAEKGKGALISVTDAAGGTKHPEIDIYAGGFNYLDEDEFAAMAMAAPWQDPENVILIINPQQGPTRVYRQNRMNDDYETSLCDSYRIDPPTPAI
jgi:hypothetical protein